MNPFGRRAVNDSRVIPSAQQNQTPSNNNSGDDLDVPAFLRKKM
jgi:hypothetical protein